MRKLVCRCHYHFHLTKRRWRVRFRVVGEGRGTPQHLFFKVPQFQLWFCLRFRLSSLIKFTHWPFNLITEWLLQCAVKPKYIFYTRFIRLNADEGYNQFFPLVHYWLKMYFIFARHLLDKESMGSILRVANQNVTGSNPYRSHYLRVRYILMVLAKL